MLPIVKEFQNVPEFIFNVWIEINVLQEMESLPFLLIVRRGNVFSIWTGTQWIGSNCLWTLDTLKFDGSIRVQFGQLCGSRYWGVLTSPGIPLISMVSGIQCVIWLAICFTVSLRQLKVDNCKDSSAPQTFTLHCTFPCFYQIFVTRYSHLTSQQHQIYW